MLKEKAKNNRLLDSKIFNLFRKDKKSFYQKNNLESGYKSYYNQPGKAIWSSREYKKFADEGYKKNVIAHRCISMIASGAANINLKISNEDSNQSIKASLIEKIIKNPNPFDSGKALFEKVYSHYLIGGNAYLQKVRDNEGIIRELYVLRPDKVDIITNSNNIPIAYRYNIENKYKDFRVDRISGKSDILHIRNFNPLNELQGLSSMEAAAYSIDQHNEASAWNQALLQNGARPSGALIVKNGSNGESGHLSDDQFNRIKEQMNEVHSGSVNAGKPLLLEGGLEWKEMSISPKDMDFINTKHSAARDIALAFGVPSQLLGIPGDATYSNMAEARLSLWEQTIIPFAENVVNSLNNWLVPSFGENLKISIDYDSITALSPRRDATWKRASNADFLSDDEKRKLVGF